MPCFFVDLFFLFFLFFFFIATISWTFSSTFYFCPTCLTFRCVFIYKFSKFIGNWYFQWLSFWWNLIRIWPSLTQFVCLFWSSGLPFVLNLSVFPLVNCCHSFQQFYISQCHQPAWHKLFMFSQHNSSAGHQTWYWSKECITLPTVVFSCFIYKLQSFSKLRCVITWGKNYINNFSWTWQILI